MADYPYALSPGSVEDFLKKASERPVPEKITQEYVKRIGYTSSNDRQIIGVLKFIKFIDSSGGPSEYYKTFRDTQKSGSIMAQALKESYRELFTSFANPQKENLENFFRTATGRGGRMLKAPKTHSKL